MWQESGTNGAITRRALTGPRAAAVSAGFALLACAGGAAAPSPDAPAPPYPPSPAIADIKWDSAGRVRLAPGSDNWPITWAQDDNQYAAWGDGGGFGGTNSDGRVSLGVARIEGPADHYRGYNVWGGKNGEHPATFGGKSYGILALGTVLYMWVQPGSGTDNYEEARLCRSTDYGATWERADWAFTKAERIIAPTFCQFGRGYAGARDQFVYCYAVRLQDDSADLQLPGQINLMRVPTGRLMERSAYEFFAGRDAAGEPIWAADPSRRRAVFEDANGVGSCLSVSFNPRLRRYFLCTEHGQPSCGNLGIFDAPEPWGPWTTVGYYRNWGDTGTTFFWNFSNKWLSADAGSFVLVFTGTGENDAWNTVGGRFVARGAAGSAAGLGR